MKRECDAVKGKLPDRKCSDGRLYGNGNAFVKGTRTCKRFALTAYFGSGLESGRILTASTIPTTLFDVIIGGVISAAFIPVFNDIMSKKAKNEAMKFVNKFVTLIVCITSIYRCGRNNFQRCTCEHTSTELYS